MNNLILIDIYVNAIQKRLTDGLSQLSHICKKSKQAKQMTSKGLLYVPVAFRIGPSFFNFLLAGMPRRIPDHPDAFAP
jgi:hypothetical protein